MIKTAKVKRKSQQKLQTTVDKDLVKDLRLLTKEVKRLKSMEFIKVFKNPWKFMWFSFLKGLMIGLGTVLGASVLVGMLVWTLSKIKLVPIVGDFIQDVIVEVQSAQK